MADMRKRTPGHGWRAARPRSRRSWDDPHVPWTEAKNGRFTVTKWFPYTGPRAFTGKDVRAIFAVEPDRIVVVTVLVFMNHRTEDTG